MTKEEIIKQLESIKENSASFHESEDDVWSKDIQAIDICLNLVNNFMDQNGNILISLSKAKCPVCGKEFNRKAYNHIYCSQECRIQNWEGHSNISISVIKRNKKFK